MEFAPGNPAELLQRFREAHEKAKKSAISKQDGSPGFHPWPTTLTEYLKKRLLEEYKICFYVLDGAQFDENYKQKAGYTPQKLGDSTETGGQIVKSLLRVDFLHAQRYLSDTESKDRAEDLSRRLNRFYERNLQKYDGGFTAVAALADSEEQLNKHFSEVFQPTLKHLNDLGYPGFADPDLVIKSSFDPESILSRNASVHYALRDPGNRSPKKQVFTLPDRYNGLGFKNLIYMVVEILDFHQRWADEKDERPLLHLVFIEEPEAHLHVQLQQVFIRKINEISPKDDPLFSTQFVVSTHSPHIIYESSFTPIRYFRRCTPCEAGNYSEVLSLSTFSQSEKDSREFLVQYMKLTHCDLFFADAAILVEGNVERLLLPLMIEKVAPELKASYLSVLEVGGAFAHTFRELIDFIGLTTLIITDLDSISPPKASSAQEGAAAVVSSTEGAEADETNSSSCMPSQPNALTSNQTLIRWLPKLRKISDLLTAQPQQKMSATTDGKTARVRVAYQTSRQVSWNGETMDVAGRTFEEAFAYENLEWCQDLSRRSLHLRVVTKKSVPSLAEIIESIHERVKGNSFDKTSFALALMMQKPSEWSAPAYITEGLTWLKNELAPCQSAEESASLGTVA